MNEVTHIHLGREQFTIAVDAHHALRAYIEEIRKQVASKDVIEEVELRMAELLGERGIDTHKVVLMKDVAYLKEQLGEATDFTDDPSVEQSDPVDPTVPKRLFRDTDNALLAGVCAGLGKYFGIDAVIIRLIFILLVIFGGGGFLLYLVLWLVIPEAKTKSDRLQMQGKSVTVGSLKEVVDRADLSGAAKRTHTIVAPLIERAATLFVKALGIFFLLIGVGLLITFTTAGIYAFTTQGASIAGQAFFPVGLKESILLASALAAAGIVSFIFVLMGLSMISRKWKVPGWISATIAGLLIIAIAATTALAASVEPAVKQRFDSRHHTQVVSLNPFSSVELHGNDTHFVFQPDATYKVEYHYLGAPVGAVAKNVNNGTLTLDTTDFVRPVCHFMCMYSGHGLEVIIHAPSVSSVFLTGGSNTFTNAAAFTQKDVHLTVDRENNIDLQYMNPNYALLAVNPDQNQTSLVLTGLQPGAFREDELTMHDGLYSINRAGTFELKTDAQCVSNEAMVMLLGYPEKVIVNGQTFPTRDDLIHAQDQDRPRPANCVQLY